MNEHFNSRTGRAYLGFSADMLSTTVLTLVQFFLVPVYLEMTSSSLYGYWLTLLSIMGWIALTDIGLGLALTRLVSGIDDDVELSKLFSTAFTLFLCLSFVIIVAGLGVSNFLPQWFDIDSADINVINETFIILVVISAIGLPLSLFGAMLNGFQNMALVHVMGIGSALAGIGVTLGLLFAGVGLVSLAYGQLVRVLLRSIGELIALKYIRPKVRLLPGLVCKQDILRLISFGGYFQLGRIANTVQTTMDNVIIAAFLGSGLVSTYAFTAKLAQLVSQNIASKIPIAAIPGMSQLFAQGDLVALSNVFIKLSRYSTRLAVFSGCYLWLGNEMFVSTWVGAEYYGGIILSLTFVYWTFQDSIYRGTVGVVYASGKIKKWTLASIIEAILNLGISLALVGHYGLVGVALGTSISKTMTTAWYSPYLICRQLELSLHTYCYRGIAIPFLLSLPSCVAMYITWSILYGVAGWIPLIAMGAVGVLSNVVLFEYSEIRGFASKVFNRYNHG